MHEMSLMEALVDLAEEEARKHQAQRINVIRVAVGTLSHVDREALRFCFDAVTRGTISDGARFDMIDIAGAGWCLDCGKEVAISERFGPCPDCGHYRVQMTRGDDFRLIELEVA
ncbi:hydrogenase maturation nickel metallochaperone HypA [Methylocystis sp. ATCC 49242]|uniref:hydrogenase maturation nickel metallochaperone HypA n=1 Tax=Methylocystis sp. ATCC 49242 TaxID=622637 RepID=UPI0001F886B5|nr:hydrogenase maturation nickel metallochaperone HypA [Methylocystis sp. ATCC 49242]